MPTTLRLTALHLALAAMMLRALMPVGWMPNPAGAAGALFVICTADGPLLQTGQHDHGKHAPDDGQHSHEECPFAAAPHVAAPVTVAQIALPSFFGRFSNPPLASVSVVFTAVYQPQSPRAPPLFA
jgi:hypothetical protein